MNWETLLAHTLLPAAALFLLVASFRHLRRARWITDTPTSRIRSAAQGFVELEGRARLMPGPAIICPLTAHRCVWWQYRIDRRSGGKRARWTTVESDSSDALFHLQDATGRCVVDPEGATVTPSKSYTWYGNSKRPSRGPAAGGGVIDALFGGQYRYREELIEVDTPLYALGDFRTQDALRRDQADEVEALIRDWKKDQASLLARFDTNRDGHIDAVEWEAARRVAQMRVRRANRSQPSTPGLHVIARGVHGHPFLLSGMTQKTLARRYTLRAALSFAGFLAAGSAQLWLLAERGLI